MVYANIRRFLTLPQVLLIFFFGNKEFKAEGNLTYDGCKVNEGDAMNISTGVFTTPRKGVYQLAFHANTVKTTI